MDKKNEIDELNELIALDQDAASAYESAVKAVSEEPIRRHLRQFQDDYTRHVKELSQAVRDLGGKPREANFAKGYNTPGFTPVSSSAGTEAALKTLKTNTKTTNKYYAQARSKPFSAAAKAIIERCFQDEKGHLTWIEQAIATRSWESSGAHP